MPAPLHRLPAAPPSRTGGLGPAARTLSTRSQPPNARSPTRRQSAPASSQLRTCSIPAVRVHCVHRVHCCAAVARPCLQQLLQLQPRPQPRRLPLLSYPCSDLDVSSSSLPSPHSSSSLPSSLLAPRSPYAADGGGGGSVAAVAAATVNAESMLLLPMLPMLPHLLPLPLLLSLPYLPLVVLLRVLLLVLLLLLLLLPLTRLLSLPLPLLPPSLLPRRRRRTTVADTDWTPRPPRPVCRHRVQSMLDAGRGHGRALSTRPTDHVPHRHPKAQAGATCTAPTPTANQTSSTHAGATASTASGPAVQDGRTWAGGADTVDTLPATECTVTNTTPVGTGFVAASNVFDPSGACALCPPCALLCCRGSALLAAALAATAASSAAAPATALIPLLRPGRLLKLPPLPPLLFLPPLLPSCPALPVCC